MLNKQLLILVSCVLSSFLLTACGGGGGGSDDSSSSLNTGSTPVSVESSSLTLPKTLEIVTNETE